MAAPYRFLFILLPVLALAVIVVSLPRTAAAPEAAPEARPTPELVHIPTEAERAFEQELEEIAASLDGTVGVAVTDVETGRSYAIRGDDWFPQQSVSKLWVALTALDEADEGRLELDEAVAIGPKDLTLFHQPIRDLVQARGAFRTDYADLMQRALTGSDNTANDRILRRVGGVEAVEDFLAAKKITGVRFGADERTKQSAIAGLRWNQAFSVGNAFFDARDRVPDAARRAADPENVLQARAPRFRLHGEFLRDQALVVGDLLVDEVGGPGEIGAEQGGALLDPVDEVSQPGAR